MKILHKITDEEQYSDIDPEEDWGQWLYDQLTLDEIEKIDWDNYEDLEYQGKTIEEIKKLLK